LGLVRKDQGEEKRCSGIFVLVLSIAWGAGTPIGFSQVQNFTPVTKEMLLNPGSDDWLMFSRTYDAQRFSPLRQINRQNVAQGELASAAIGERFSPRVTTGQELASLLPQTIRC
jgi:glucose dehydrogenase